MKIQSTPPQPRNSRQPGTVAAAEAYEAAKEKFEASSEKQLDKADSWQKWGGRASFAAGLGALAGSAVLAEKYLFSIDSYGAAFPVVGVGFAVGALGFYLTNKGMESSLSKTDFLQDRVELVQVRDQYREALIQELNDDGVGAIANPRWNQLKQREDQTSVLPTRAETAMLAELDQLALLADNRLKDGWQNKLAHLQDDPTKFQKELSLVQENDGLLQAMVAGHGETQQ